MGIWIGFSSETHEKQTNLTSNLEEGALSKIYMNFFGENFAIKFSIGN